MPMPAAMAAWLSGSWSFARDKDFALVGFVKPVKDRHQRRFARAVFADDPVDRAGHDAD